MQIHKFQNKLTIVLLAKVAAPLLTAKRLNIGFAPGAPRANAAMSRVLGAEFLPKNHPANPSLHEPTSMVPLAKAPKLNDDLGNFPRGAR
jgi:hypothetical protein